MKKTRTLLVALLATLASTSQAALVGDTLVIDQPERVKIETRDTVQRIVISGMKDDPAFHYVQRISIPDTSAVRRRLSSVKDFNKVAVPRKGGKASKLDVGLHISAGLNTMTGAPSGYDFKLWPSFHYALSVQADWHPLGRRNVWSAGLGYGVDIYRLSGDAYWTKGAGGAMELTPYNRQTMSDTRTWLYTFSLQVPLLYTHRFDDRGRAALTLGAVVNFNTGAHTTRAFTMGGEDYSVNLKHIGQRPVTVDALVRLKVPSLPAVYCRYSPMTFFKDGCGPEMHRLSFGFFF